jgi:hypothetical protein
MKAEKALNTDTETGGEVKSLESLYAEFFEAYGAFEKASDVMLALQTDRQTYVQKWNERFAPANEDFLKKQEIVDNLKKEIEAKKSQ